MYPLNHPDLIELLTIIHSNVHRLLDSPKSHSTPRLISSRTVFAGKSTFKMANPVDHEAFQAAQALCMLAVDARQQSIDGNETEDDDCVITHARPVVHRYHPYRRPEPQQAPLTVAVATPPTPDLQPTAARHPLPEERPTTIQQPTPGGQPSPAQSPSHAVAGDDAHTADQYSFRALTLQALLAAPEGEGWSWYNVADWLEEEYPELLEKEANRRLRKCLGHALNSNIHMLERCPAVEGEKATRYRIPARAHETATIIAWKTKQPPLPKQSDFELQCKPLVKIPYTWKSLVLQGLLAAPEGQWMQAREVINYLATQYPQFLGFRRNYLTNSTHIALTRTGVIVERSTKFGLGGHAFWRLAPGVRDEATKLAWPASATHCEPE